MISQEDIQEMRAHFDGLQSRHNDELRQTLVFHQWLYYRALQATQECKDRLAAVTGIER